MQKYTDGMNVLVVHLALNDNRRSFLPPIFLMIRRHILILGCPYALTLTSKFIQHAEVR